jgi:hypothetical protein
MARPARDHERDRSKPVHVAARDRSQDHRRDPDEHEGDADPLDAGPEIDEVQRPDHIVDPKGQLQAKADDDRSDERAIEQRRDRGLDGCVRLLVRDIAQFCRGRCLDAGHRHSAVLGLGSMQRMDHMGMGWLEAPQVGGGHQAQHPHEQERECEPTEDR